MSLPTGISTLLAGDIVESARVEFKESWDPQASLKTICAFANDIDNWGGGYLVIGVRENPQARLKPVGIDPAKVDTYQKDILNRCKLIRPSYMPIVDVESYEGKTFLVIWAPGGSVRPYSSPKSMGKKSERVYWIRKASSTIAPADEDLRELYSMSNNVPFDDRVNHGAEVLDLNLTLIESYLRETASELWREAASMDFTELCRRMNIVEGPAEYTKPKNVGLMFFTLDPRRWFPYAQIDVVEMPDGEGGDRLVEHTFAGPLHQQLREALLYLRGSVLQEEVVKLPEQAESSRHFNYPYAAVEEALVNAVYHRGYDLREPIEVRILPDRIEILSFPGADRSISIQGLREYRAISRRYRNRRIGEYLKELRLTEGRNTGIRKIVRAMRENGSPDPVFETDEERTYFLVTLGKRIGADSLPSAPTPSKPVGDEVRRGLSARKRRILELLGENPSLSMAELAASLGVTTKTIQRDIAHLRGADLLGRIGPRKGGRWVVREGTESSGSGYFPS